MAAKSSAVVVVVLLVVDFDDVVQELEGPLAARQEVRQRQRLPRAEQWQGSSSAERQLSGSADLMRGFSSCRKVHWSSSPSRSNSLAHLMALSRASLGFPLLVRLGRLGRHCSSARTREARRFAGDLFAHKSGESRLVSNAAAA